MLLRVLNVLSTFNEAVCGVCANLVSLALGLISAILFAAVTTRYCLNSPLTWAEDATGFLLVWMVLLGAPVGLRNHAHVAIDSLVQKLPAKIQALFQVVGGLIILFVAWFILFYGVDFVKMGMRRIVPSIDWLPFGYSYLALPVGFGLMFIIAFEQSLRNIMTLCGVSMEK